LPLWTATTNYTAARAQPREACFYADEGSFYLHWLNLRVALKRKQTWILNRGSEMQKHIKHFNS
jgi:hypothetical protein